eukprot:UN03438
MIPFCFVLSIIWESHFISAYGKFGGGACKVNPRLGWWLLEFPHQFVFIYNFIGSKNTEHFMPRVLGLLFCMHYLYRGWLFPYLIRVHNQSKGFSLDVALGGSLFTIPYGYMTAKWYGEYGEHLTNPNWTNDIRP